MSFMKILPSDVFIKNVLSFCVNSLLLLGYDAEKKRDKANKQYKHST